MRLKSSRRRQRCTPRTAAAVTPLEPRLLMAASTIDATAQEAVTSTIPAFSSHDARYQSIPLDSYFEDPNVPGTLVTFETSKGNILVALTDTATPKTVASFLGYVASDAYDDTIFHRSALDAAGTGTISQDNPAGIIQGGGYVLGNDGLTHIPQDHYVPDEYTTELYGDIAGTIAMAKTGDADSATTEWYFNNLDNSSGLDTPTTDGNGNTTSYTVFGKVLSGMSVVSAIAELPTDDIAPVPIQYESDGVTPVTTPAPISGLTATQIANGSAIQASNLVYVYQIVEQAGTTYTVTSSDPSLVTPTVSNGNLSFTYGASQTGTAIISITATNAYDNTTASQSFAVTVPSATDASSAVTAGDDTEANVVTGQATVIHALSNDTVGTGAFDATTDSAGNAIPAAIDPTTITVVTQPAHGTATVDPTTGDITYTATGGFTGTDTMVYKVRDTAGVTSPSATITFDVIPAPVSVTVGAGTKVRSVVFTQPDGARGTLALTGAAAQVTFSAGAITQVTKGGVDHVTGAGATISAVAVTNIGKQPVLTVSATGRDAVTLSNVTDDDVISQLIAPNVTLTGVLSVGGMKRLTLGAASAADITLGQSDGDTVVAINTAVNTGLTAGAITTFTSKSWTITDGGSHVIAAAAIGKLNVTGVLADGLSISTTSGYGITTANVRAASGEWDVAGSIRKATLTKPTSAFSLVDQSVIQTLQINGDLTGHVVGAFIDDMTITGSLNDGTVQTDALFNAAQTQLVKLTIGGKIVDSIIATAGNIGTVTAKSISASQVYAGATSATISADKLPTSTDDLSAFASIKSISFSAARSTFSSTEIAAYTISRLGLGQVIASNGGTGFGVSAHELDALSAALKPGGALVLTKAQTKTAATLATYISKHKKTLTDFSVQIY